MGDICLNLLSYQSLKLILSQASTYEPTIFELV